MYPSLDSAVMMMGPNTILGYEVKSNDTSFSPELLLALIAATTRETTSRMPDTSVVMSYRLARKLADQLDQVVPDDTPLVVDPDDEQVD